MSSAIVKASETHVTQADPLADPPVRPRFQRAIMFCSAEGRQVLKMERELRQDHAAVSTFLETGEVGSLKIIDRHVWIGDEPDTNISSERKRRRDQIAARRLSESLGGATSRVANTWLENVYGRIISGDCRSIVAGGSGAALTASAEACLKAGANPDTFGIPGHAAESGHAEFLGVLMRHGANKQRALEGAIGGGQTDIVRQLLDDGAPITEQMTLSATRHGFTDIATLLRDTQESRRTLTFSAAVAQEAEGNADVVIKPERGTFRLDINDCTMYGSKGDLASFIQDQRRVFSLTEEFNAWKLDKPLPQQTVAATDETMRNSYARLDGCVAVYHNGSEVEDYLPFVRAHFVRATAKTDYLYLRPGDVTGVPREEMRWVKEAKQEATEAADADLALVRKFTDAGIVDTPKMRIATEGGADAPRGNTRVPAAEADPELLPPPSSTRLRAAR